MTNTSLVYELGNVNILITILIFFVSKKIDSKYKMQEHCHIINLIIISTQREGDKALQIIIIMLFETTYSLIVVSKYVS